MSEAFQVIVAVPVFLGFVENDQAGRPMVTPATGTMVWSNSTTATGTLVASPSGLSATYTPVAVGTDVVSFTLTVTNSDGTTATFSDTAAITVVAAVQVLTSVAITEIPALV